MAQVEIGAKVTVDAGNAAARVLELKESIKKLNEEFKGTKQGTDEQKQAFINLQQAQSELKKANKELGNSLSETSGSAKESGGSFKNLKDQISTISPAAGGAADGAGKFNASLNVLKANPIIAILAILTAIIIALINKFKDMDAASDKMSDAMGELSSIFDMFMNAILTPLIDGFVALIGFIVQAAEFMADKLGVSSIETSQNLGRLTTANRELDEAQNAQAESLATSNRKLQEAREIAGDANVPIKERIKALKEAARIEKEELDKVVEFNRKKLAIQLEQFATEMGARDLVIGKIKEGTIESLKAAKAELLTQKNVNEAKVQELSKYIIAAEEAAAQSAKIGKKTATQIASLEREEASKRAEVAKAAEDKRRQKNENDAAYKLRMEKLTQAEILAGIKDQYEKERLMAEFKLKDDIRMAEEDLKNGKITGKQKTALVEQLKKDEIAKINEINTKQYVALQKIEEDRIKEEDAIRKKKEEDDAKAAAAKIKKDQDDKVKDAKDKLELAKLATEDENLSGIQKRALLDKQRALNQEYFDKGLIDQATFTKNSQDIDKADTDIKKSENEAKKQLLDSYLGALDGVANVIGKQTTAGKAISVASALISTYEGIAKGVKLGYPMAIPAVISAAATGFAAVKNILAVKVPNGGGGGGGSAPITPNLGSAPLVPREQTTTTSLTGQTLASMNATASRAYVVESDITSGQQRIERINRAARLA